MSQLELMIYVAFFFISDMKYNNRLQVGQLHTGRSMSEH